jgi:osmotically-inducible protein OsmY
MTDPTPNDPTPYRLEHAREALAKDERVGALDIQIAEANGHAVLTGVVATADRREAIEAIVRQHLPDMEVHNSIEVEELAPPHEPETFS